MALDFTEWDALSAEDQARSNEYVPQARALAGELLRLIEKMEAVDALYTNDISAIFTGMTNGQGVRNPSGLADAAEMSDTDHVTLESYYQGIIASYGSPAHKANLVQAAGLQAILGGD